MKSIVISKGLVIFLVVCIITAVVLRDVGTVVGVDFGGAIILVIKGFQIMMIKPIPN